MEFVPNTLCFSHSALGDMACIFRLAAARGDLAQAIRIRRLLTQHLGALAFLDHCYAETHEPFDRTVWRCPVSNQVTGGAIRSGYTINNVRELRLVDERGDIRLRVYVRERLRSEPVPLGHPPLFEVLRVLHDGWP